MIEKPKTQSILISQAALRRSWTRVAVLTLLAAGIGLAQEAQVSGRVTDASGAVVPDVKVTITNTDTGAARDTTTNDLGYYTLPLLQPGNYKIAAEKQGFRGRVID